jgi:hypothetical protein
MNNDTAIDIAIKFLNTLPFKEMYKQTPVKINDKGDIFEVWFEREVPSKPLHGLVKIQKLSGEASWIPLR